MEFDFPDNDDDDPIRVLPAASHHSYENSSAWTYAESYQTSWDDPNAYASVRMAIWSTISGRSLRICDIIAGTVLIRLSCRIQIDDDEPLDHTRRREWYQVRIRHDVTFPTDCC